MIKILKIFLCVIILQTIVVFSLAADSLAADSGEGSYSIVRDIIYHQEDTINCRLDLYIPEAANDCMTLIWFHGGSLKEGSRTRIDASVIGDGLASEGIAAVIVDYRLYPDALFPDFLVDAAASVNWVLEHIEDFGGDSDRVFVGGHSAGGYITAMLALDRSYLDSFNKDPGDVCGYIPVSGQMDCHTSVKEEWGLDPKELIVNSAAPLLYVIDPVPPMLFIYAENDSPGRGEINQRITSTLIKNENENIYLDEIQGSNHSTIIHSNGQMNHLLYEAIVDFMGEISCL